jgi:replicative DNA helicase Mcm
MPDTVVQPSEEMLVRSWEEFLRKYYKAKLNELALEYPDRRSLAVDYWDIDRHSQPLAEHLLRRPADVLFAAEKAVQCIDLPLPEPPRFHVRVQRLPDYARVPVRSLRSAHLGRFVAIEGLVKKASDVRPRVEDAIFRCLRCDGAITEPQDEHLVLKEPLQCYEDQGGCGHSTGFKLLTDKSRFVDSQKIEIQESPEALRGGEQPQRLAVFVEDDLCGHAKPGDRLVVNGILRAVPRRVQGGKGNTFEIHLQAVSVEREEQAYDEVRITPEDEARIAALANSPDVYEQLVRSLAPSIHGMETEKEALVLQLFGGVEKRLPDGTRVRGDIHILLVGDPGLAKSQILRYAARLAPRGIYTSGKGTTAAGLTAAAVKDEASGGWVYEAGALVLGDRGLVSVDEIDKMSDEDRSAMHEALEQGTVSKSTSAGLVQFNSRCSVLGAANPRDGRFDLATGSPAEQVDMEPPLLSRFDVILPLIDIPSKERDAALAEHVVGAHRAGAIRAYREQYPEGAHSAEAEATALAPIQPPIPPDLLRKWIAHARRTCYPVLAPDVARRVRDHYVTLRNPPSGRDGKPQPLAMTPRQLEGIVRLAEASARVRLAHEAGPVDFERAVRIMDYWLRRVAGEGNGLWDLDKLVAGVSTTTRGRIQRVITLVAELEGGHEYGAHLPDLLAKLPDVPEHDVREIMERLARDGRLLQPRGDGAGWYRRNGG